MFEAVPYKNLPDQVAVICTECGKPSASRVHGSVDVPADDPRNPKQNRPFNSRYLLTRCQHCWEPAVFVQDEVAPDELDDPFQVWPGDQRVLSPAIPAGIRSDLDEAKTCFKAKAYKAAAVMVRRTVEGVVQDLDPALQGTLATMLLELGKGNKVDQRLVEWAQDLRLLGNEGAHSGQQVSTEDARDAIELAEALVDYVYVFSSRYDAFKQRRANSTQGGGH